MFYSLSWSKSKNLEIINEKTLISKQYYNIYNRIENNKYKSIFTNEVYSNFYRYCYNYDKGYFFDYFFN